MKTIYSTVQRRIKNAFPSKARGTKVLALNDPFSPKHAQPNFASAAYTRWMLFVGRQSEGVTELREVEDLEDKEKSKEQSNGKKMPLLWMTSFSQ